MFFCFFLLSVSCLQAQDDKTFKGVVLDKETMEPIQGALVHWGTDLQTFTDENGFFSIKNVYGDVVKLFVISIFGYENLEYKDFSIQSNTEPVKFFLVPEPTLVHYAYFPTPREALNNLGEVILSSTRLDESSPLAFTNVGKQQIAKQNLGQDLPILLNFTPSVVTTSDAGAGVGYTGIRVRGSDATRTNITINGIPYNDAESQGSFWVNMPDFASSVSSIQIQRGVGTSTNGAGAFGASVNIQTNQKNEKAYLELNNSAGSFRTMKNTLMLGTGLLAGKFTVDARLSSITSNGFVDRASSDLKSFYVSGAYYGKRATLRANVFSGKERTYQAWNGVPEARLRGDAKGMQDYIVRNYLSTADSLHLLQSNSRTYNAYRYDNQTDNYQQDHYQLFYSYDLGAGWNAQTALHYTYGRVYYEEFRAQDNVSTYTASPLVIGNQSITNMDVIRRRWLDNDFFGGIYSVNYKSNRVEVILGGGWNRYLGRHFGEVIWAQYATTLPTRSRYYNNDADKQDANLYAKAYVEITDKLRGFVDMQWRNVFYDFEGLQIDALGTRPLQQNTRLNFFNPKAGLSFEVNNNVLLYSSLSVGNREPNREDFVNATQESRPKSERMYDIEFGTRVFGSLGDGKWNVNVNGYYMLYDNQLVLTGKVNDVGNYTRTNVKNSFRRGVEVEASLQPNAKLQWNVNFTLSQNRIKDFQEFTDDYDNGGQKETKFGTTDIAFSPAFIGASQLAYSPAKGFTVALLSKYVGKQYLDNTSNEARKLDAFATQDVRLAYEWKMKASTLTFSCLLNNVLGAEYESNGYTYGYWSGGTRTTENFYYPQAGRNFLLGVGLRF
ncbi:MAG: TonB-dependent receptor [Bacteroidetes bacterium]|nr:MAG: TonB-dependent receptor [Bacteroidota bacterium]